MERLTEAQRRALGEVAADRVRWLCRGQLRFESTRFPPAIRHDVVQRLANAGLVAVGGKVDDLNALAKRGPVARESGPRTGGWLLGDAQEPGSVDAP